MFSWGATLISVRGKRVLIKSVLQAIPMFSMSCFLLPTFCRELEAIIARFWQQKKTNKKGLHCSTLHSLCVPKGEGGIGFRDMSKFNISLLVKQGWQLMETPRSLIVRILRAKYYCDSNFLEYSLGSSPSLIWRSIWFAKTLLKSGLGWGIGNGANVSIWADYWLPGKSRNLVSTTRVKGLDRVCDLMRLNPNKCHQDLIFSNFNEKDAKRIIRISFPVTVQPNKIVSSYETSSTYSVKSGYNSLLDHPHLS